MSCVYMYEWGLSNHIGSYVYGSNGLALPFGNVVLSIAGMKPLLFFLCRIQFGFQVIGKKSPYPCQSIASFKNISHSRAGRSLSPALIEVDNIRFKDEVNFI